jgi:hypothetical protein
MFTIAGIFGWAFGVVALAYLLSAAIVKKWPQRNFSNTLLVLAVPLMICSMLGTFGWEYRGGADVRLPCVVVGVGEFPYLEDDGKYVDSWEVAFAPIAIPGHYPRLRYYYDPKYKKGDTVTLKAHVGGLSGDTLWLGFGGEASMPVTRKTDSRLN